MRRLNFGLRKSSFLPPGPTPPTSLHLHVEFLGKGQLGKEPRKEYIHSELVLTPNLAIYYTYRTWYCGIPQHHVSSSFPPTNELRVKLITVSVCPSHITCNIIIFSALSLVRILHTSFVCSDMNLAEQKIWKYTVMRFIAQSCYWPVYSQTYNWSSKLFSMLFTHEDRAKSECSIPAMYMKCDILISCMFT